ncbi:hypothetical protein VNO77_21813 [Canavalia gladiata]|uniref:Protein PHLOEM PROTEIN 2-LIKE A9-like n=1 Tax=Canavalia gladiata TaxID=3824 RepID=A0AAN9QAG9_CANGL
MIVTDQRQVGDGYEIKPRGLNIVWGNESRYWKLLEDGGAKLIQISWLEVSGVVPIKKEGTYRINFHVKVKEDAFGWNGPKVLVMAKVGRKGAYQYKEVTLSAGDSLIIPSSNKPLDIKVENGSDTTIQELYFGLYEVWSGKWKGGLELIKVEVLPIYPRIRYQFMIT